MASLFGCLFLCLGGSATNSYATTNLTVTDFAGLQSAFTTANANTTEDYVVTINGTIQMTTPLSLTKAKLTLSGNGTILGYNETAENDMISANDGSTLKIDGLTIKGYTSPYSAIGIYGSTLNLNNATITGNNSTTDESGAIYIGDNDTEITNSTISDNIGGGIFMGGATLNLRSTKITGNTSTHGGGINNFGATINIYDSIISNNSSSDSSGGIYNKNGSINLISGEISGNRGTEGGGIYNKNGAVNLKGGKIYNNTASSGAGIFTECQTNREKIDSSATNLTPIVEAVPEGAIVSQCSVSVAGGEITGNKATKYGGGIYLSNGTTATTTTTSNSIVNISGGNIADNTATRGGNGVFVSTGTTLNLSSDAFINKNNDVYLDGTDTAVNVLSKLNKVTRENPIALTPSDTTTVSTKAGVVGNKLVNYFAKASALEADMQDYFILSDYVSTDAHIVQSDFTSEENYLILGKRMVSLFLKFSGIVGAENETISLTKNDIITKSPAYQAVLAKYAKKGYTLEFYFDENHTNLLPADQAIVDDTTLYAQYVKNPNTLDNVAIYAIIGIATVAGASVLLKSQKRSRR